ncbi:hypothetical protein L7F22_038710 [Adiantum nelumboides]|nr:hypothetical protein [Adiantum nelumboides]
MVQHNKKDIHVGKAKEEGLDVLREVLYAERKIMAALETELEKERNAIAIATSKTMAMISRLQEEKSAMQLMVAQLQRMTEEKAEYDEPAMALLKEILFKEEAQKHALKKNLIMDTLGALVLATKPPTYDILLRPLVGLDTITGDIVCVLQLKEHAKFKRKGDDLFVEHTLNLKEAPCGFQIVIVHLDGRKLLIKPAPGEIVKPGQFKATNDKGMPMYQRPFLKGKLYIHFSVGFLESDSLSTDQCKALEAILPLKPPSEMTNMELGECDKTILQNVNLGKEMKRKQQHQQSQKVQEDPQEARRSKRTRKSPSQVLRKNGIGPEDQQQNDISGQDEDNSKNVWTKSADKHLGGEPHMNARRYVMSFQF